MQLISSNICNKFNFNGYIRKKDIEKKTKYQDTLIKLNPNSLDSDSVRLVKVLALQFESSWGKVREGKLTENALALGYLADDGSLITFKPVYGPVTPQILMQISNGNLVERVYFDKYHPEDFRYEKVRFTDKGGEISVKNFHSVWGKDVELYSYINESLRKYAPKVISENLLEETFSRPKRAKTSKIDTLV